MLNAPLRLQEIQSALSSRPSNSASGADGFTYEALSVLSAPSMEGILSHHWEAECIPRDWCTGIIHPLFKGGDAHDLGNSRGLSLLSCVGKLFETILNARLRSYLREMNGLVTEQGGFRSHRECSEHVITLHETLR